MVAWRWNKRNLPIWQDSATTKIPDTMLFEDVVEAITSLVVRAHGIVVDAKEFGNRVVARKGREIHEFFDQVPDERKAIDVWIVARAE